MEQINNYILSKIKNETNITEKLKISKPTKVNIKHTLFPSTKQELKNMILDEISKNGKNIEFCFKFRVYYSTTRRFKFSLSVFIIPTYISFASSSSSAGKCACRRTGDLCGR